MDLHPLEVLRRPIVTEKSTLLQEQGKYVFEVARQANKPQIKEAVERAFDVHVQSVNVISVPPKSKHWGRRTFKTNPWKKAIVTLKPGDRIEIFESA